jgi:hypothetical protein
MIPTTLSQAGCQDAGRSRRPTTRRCGPRPDRLVGLLGLLGLLALACAEQGLAPVRAVTYPPDFHYLTRAEIQGTMAEFARAVDALDRILAREGGAGAADRDAVVGLLEQLRLQGRHLEQGEGSNHPGLHQDAARFTRDVDRALIGARREPPDYSGTARITGSCTACHAPRHPGAA